MEDLKRFLPLYQQMVRGLFGKEWTLESDAGKTHGNYHQRSSGST
ncbi:hypothetical protein CFter6_1236 [Collimonas fungivorans]|uniref:Uncharacterized protein n=1 Tax=Collimonas fungivorans TaxID=158899 RepID=A0A127P866_9BURK|nr:hypothetical protein CFter6_1236 [Collimonas fungivorans]